MAALTALLLLGCKRTPEPTPGPCEPAVAAAPASAEPDASSAAPDWQVQSLDHSHLLRQTSGESGTCLLESVALPARTVTWSARLCVASRHQLVFVADDGERFIVLEPFPAYAEGGLPSATVAGAYWRELLVDEVLASEVAEVSRLRPTTKHFYWLKGALGEEGPAPRASAEGVVVQTLEGASPVIGWDGRVSGGPSQDAGAALHPPVIFEGPARPQAAFPAAPADPPAVDPRAQDERDAQAAADARRKEAAELEAAWRARFRELNETVASLESQLAQARAEEARLNGTSVHDWTRERPSWRSGMPAGAANVSVPVGVKDGCVVYSGGETVCNPQLDGEFVARVQWEMARRLEETQRTIAALEGQLADARAALEELDRAASFAAVPREWRR